MTGMEKLLWAALGLVLAVILMVAMVAAHAAEERTEVDANLITGLDVSSSINAQETMLQIEGMAHAIQSPAVVAAIQQGKLGRIGFTVFLWADGDYPAVGTWRSIASAEDAAAAGEEILARLQAILDKDTKSVGTLTNLSGALDHAAALIRESPFQAGRVLVNIIGNGEDNVGEGPSRARGELLSIGATINGVVVGADPAVVGYFRKQVVGGKGAFTLTATGPGDLANVLAMKFVTEVSRAEPSVEVAKTP
ncbi:DUF1194 domain-containing protein [Dongia deserti]|uniref:DUF1194 domain-containing protein n=1 Tax=Dongia deserti TaxID=2268030 RepID=UPI000E65969B|nr:DUF1194 domain-containing protein [Dongia deserti]